MDKEKNVSETISFMNWHILNAFDKKITVSTSYQKCGLTKHLIDIINTIKMLT